MKNILTIDLEDWYQGVQYDHFEAWSAFEARGGVEKNTRELLALFKQHRAHATFFVLGRVAELYPGLIREIDAAGHELANHGWTHRRLWLLTPEQFRAELARTDAALGTALGRSFRSRGYRAPYFTVSPKTQWAYDVMSDYGLEYDSSVFPIYNYLGGAPTLPRFPYRVGRILEVPISTLRGPGLNLPFSGGFYLRVLPGGLLRRGVRALNRAGQPALVFLHPRELDPGQPRIAMPWWQHLIYYWNLGGTRAKFAALLAEFEFGGIAEVLL